MQIKEIIIGIPVLFFIFWVFAAPLPKDRIERTCSPISWVGNMVTSTTALANDKHTQTSSTWSTKLTYGCEYLIWRLLYQDEYNKALEAGRVDHDVDGRQVVNKKDPALLEGEVTKEEAIAPPVELQKEQEPAKVTGAAADREPEPKVKP